VRSANLWARLPGPSKAVVEGVEFDEDEQAVVVSVRPRKATKQRCARGRIRTCDTRFRKASEAANSGL
jgi:hypothetical protein